MEGLCRAVEGWGANWPSPRSSPASPLTLAKRSSLVLTRQDVNSRLLTLYNNANAGTSKCPPQVSLLKFQV